MDTIDPELRGSASSSYATQHAPTSSFSANTIRLPLPHQQTPLPSHDGGHAHPYYTLPHPPVHSPGSRLLPDVHHQYETSPAVETNGDPRNDTKRRERACEACRGLKVRCEPNANDTAGACRRCAKAGRRCVTTAPGRKRYKKADSRVAELEKRIDALTAGLEATKRGGPLDLRPRSGGPSPEVEGTILRDTNEEPSPSPSVQAKHGSVIGTGEWPRQSERSDAATELRSLPIPSHTPSSSSRTLVGRKRRRSNDADDLEETVPPEPETSASMKYPSDVHHEYADVVDRKILTASAATGIFDHYNKHMAPHFPTVVFPPDTSAAQVRRTKPTLFLAILSASSGPTHPKLQRTLSKELMRVYADRVIVKGQKTLELIQALQVTVIWYSPPENYEESKFYQLIHIAAVMTLDLGLGKRTKPTKQRSFGFWQDHPFRRTPLPDPHSVDCRRAWLGCYFLCVNTSMALRRPNLLRWNAYTQECIEVLEASSNAYESDKVLCQWARLQHITEEISIQFSMDDAVAQVSGLDTKLQYTLRGFERQLDDWRKQVPKHLYPPSLELFQHVVNLYMHEAALHTEEECNSDPGTPGLLLTPAHISALSVCLSSIHGLLDIFLSFATATVRSLPVFHCVRVVYACVLLIKMYLAATADNSELGKVVSKDDLKVEHYFDRLLDQFKAAAENEMSRAAQKCLVVLVMLRKWFQKQSSRKSDMPETPVGAKANTRWGPPNLQVIPDDGTGKEGTALRQGYQQIRPNDAMYGQPMMHVSPDQSTSIPRLHTASTPLQLLSEVATSPHPPMEDSAGTSTPGAQMTMMAGQESYNYAGEDNSIINTAAAGPTATRLSYTDSSLGGDGALHSGLDGVGSKFDWNATMGNEELEQAMGMTLGDWDLGSVLQADDFLFDLLDGGPMSAFEGSS